jgi:ABC-type multidrug transport system permease subunit
VVEFFHRIGGIVKNFLGIISGAITVIALSCTVMWFWVGIVAGAYMGVQAALAGAGIFSLLFHIFGYGTIFGIGTLVLGIIATGISATVTGKLLG